MAEQFEAFDKEAEEASWANGRGFYHLLSGLMRSLSIHELNQDHINQYLTLDNLFTWTSTFYREKEKEKCEKILTAIKKKLIDAEKESKYNPIKSKQTLMEGTDKIREAKLLIVQEMKHSNLLITVREKGSDLYN